VPKKTESPKPKKKPAINNLAEANEALYLLGYHRRRVEVAAIAARNEIAKIKQDVDSAMREDRKLAGAIFRDLDKFLRTHRDEIVAGGRKTVALTHGVLGFRLPPESLVLSPGFTEADAIAALRKRHAAEAALYIQVTESLRKDDLKAMFDDEELAQLGLELDQEELLVIEPAQETLANGQEVA